MSNILILYYSRRGQNYVSGGIQHLAQGNTELCAQYIQRAVGGELFEIDTVQPYSADYTVCTREAKTELQQQARPALKRTLDSLDGYDTVFVCGPCWWGTYPMAVFTQLEQLNWQGKHVLPLMTHEGSGLGSCQRDLQRVCQGASFGKGLAVQGANAPRAEATVARWAREQVEQG